MELKKMIEKEKINDAIQLGLEEIHDVLQSAPHELNDHLYEIIEKRFPKTDIDLYVAGVVMMWLQNLLEFNQDVEAYNEIPVGVAFMMLEPIKHHLCDVDSDIKEFMDESHSQ